MTKIEIDELARQVRSRDDLLVFVRALVEDLRIHRERWENSTLESYLGAMASWLEDCQGFYENSGRPVPDQPSWQVVADILMASTMCEMNMWELNFDLN